MSRPQCSTSNPNKCLMDQCVRDAGHKSFHLGSNGDVWGTDPEKKKRKLKRARARRQKLRKEKLMAEEKE